MKTSGVRIYGKNDLRLESFELPEIKYDEVLGEIFCDSICMSSHKAAILGEEHKRVPNDVFENPIIIGHEFSGRILKVGDKWQEIYQPGMKFTVQPAIYAPEGPVGVRSAPGYSYKFAGGDTTHCILPNELIENKCLLPYSGESYYKAALSEPFSCVIGAIRSNYHTIPGKYNHVMDIKNDGRILILGGGGPMGTAFIIYLISRAKIKPSILVVADIDNVRLTRLEKLFPKNEISPKGFLIEYLNISDSQINKNKLMGFTQGFGYNDVFVLAPDPNLITLGSSVLADDGCLNFFAGPGEKNFSALINFYNIHYNFQHIIGTSGGNANDMREALELMENGMDPSPLITHIGGLDAVVSTTLNLPDMPGGKKLIYTHISLPLTAIEDFKEKSNKELLFYNLHQIVAKTNGLWSFEAEQYLMAHGKRIKINEQ
jgi:threonine dehydrogenase-like Zn-dependent dehydrogenase